MDGSGEATRRPYRPPGPTGECEKLVDALRLIFRAELRRRWRSWLALAILIAVVGGVVMASAAAGRRTATAFPSFVRTHGYDFVVFNGSPLPQLARYPAVASITTAPVAYNGQPVCACTHPIDNNNFNVVYVPPKEMSRTVNLVAGRMPNPTSPDEVLASFNLQRDNGVHVGTVLRMRMYAASQSEAVNNATGAGPPPTGPFVSFHVVGMEAAVDEFQAGTTPLYDVYTTPAFARSVLPKTTSGFLYLVKLRHGAADVDAFKTYAKSLGIDDFTDLSTPEVLIAGSIHPQAVGWWLLAALAALAGAAVVGQALSRTRRGRATSSPSSRRSASAGASWWRWAWRRPSSSPWSVRPGRWLSPTPSPRSRPSAMRASPSRQRASASTDPSFCSARSPPCWSCSPWGCGRRCAPLVVGRTRSDPTRRLSSGWWVRRVRRQP